MDEFDDGPDHASDRDAAILWARNLLSRMDWVIFDTETTGLRGAQIVQVGVIHPFPGGGCVTLIDTLVKPSIPIPAASTSIHGITDEAVADAPTLAECLSRMARHMHRHEVVLYNKGFDQGVLYGQLRALLGDREADTWLTACRWTCAMQWYSQFVGEISWRGDYKWQKLPGAGHDAIGDCRATLAVIQGMAAANMSRENDEL